MCKFIAAQFSARSSGGVQHLWHTARNEAIAIVGKGGADHLPVPAEFQFELLNKLSSSVVLHNFNLDLPGRLNLQCFL